MTEAASHLTTLECSECRTPHDADKLQTMCTKCAHPLLARYGLEKLKGQPKSTFENGPPTLWRYASLLPVKAPKHRITLGEGNTPMLRVDRIGAKLGLKQVWVKEEGVNPTGTFKARGLCMAVARATELGVTRFAVPTAGNAGVALAAYAARAGASARVFVPEDAPTRIISSLQYFGADIVPVKGLISDAGKACAEYVKANPGVMDVSTLKEPYRAEGKKTMGLEVCLDFEWGAPDVVVYPTGGGTGIVGIRKAYEELTHLGWTQATVPRLVSVQAEGCMPVVKAFNAKQTQCEFFPNAATKAAGLRVPKPYADKLVLRCLRESKGAAVAVSETELDEGVRALAREGINASPEGGAAWSGLKRLVDDGTVAKSDRVVVFNTGSGLAY